MKQTLISAALCLLFLLLPHRAQADYKSCLALYRAQKYRKAAGCLRQLVKKFDSIPKLTKAQRLAKGTAMRSAALALNKAAKGTKSLDQAGYLRTQSIALLARYDREKLYPSAERQQSTNRIRLQILEAVRLTPLTVVSGSGGAAISIQGYKYKAQARGKWSQNVRPGKYTVSVVYKGNKAQTKSVLVIPGQPAIATFIPPKPVLPAPNPKKTIGWVLLGTGAAIAAGSAIPFVLLSGSNAEVAKLTNDIKACGTASCSVTAADVMREGEKGQTYQAAAFITLGLGVAVAAVGIILVALPAPKPTTTARTKTLQPQATRDTFVLSFGF